MNGLLDAEPRYTPRRAPGGPAMNGLLDAEPRYARAVLRADQP